MADYERIREAWLFYGYMRLTIIMYVNELDNLNFVKTIHIINDEPDYTSEKGFITISN